MLTMLMLLPPTHCRHGRIWDQTNYIPAWNILNLHSTTVNFSFTIISTCWCKMHFGIVHHLKSTEVYTESILHKMDGARIHPGSSAVLAWYLKQFNLLGWFWTHARQITLKKKKCLKEFRKYFRDYRCSHWNEWKEHNWNKWTGWIMWVRRSKWKESGAQMIPRYRGRWVW